MADPYASIANIDKSIQEKLGSILEIRGSDIQQKLMRESYLASLVLPKKTKALEVGCGTGVVTRYLSELKNVETVIGIDPSSVFVERAKELSAGISSVSFSSGDARSLSFADASFDLVVFHTTLCHIPLPEQALKEAYRVLRAGGILAIFDGDYASASVALSQHDPLQVVVERMVSDFVENVWLIRSLPKYLKNLGLNLQEFSSHGYTAVSDPTYMLTLIERGVELMVLSGTLGKTQGEALRSEAARRVENGEFFGHISYISAISKK